jgi:sensor domain CHASE-containing protein
MTEKAKATISETVTIAKWIFPIILGVLILWLNSRYARLEAHENLQQKVTSLEIINKEKEADLNKKIEIINTKLEYILTDVKEIKQKVK